MNSQARTELAARIEAIRSASKKFLVTRETMAVFPSVAAFGRLLHADIELHHAIDPDEQKSLWSLIAIALLLLFLKVVGNVTLLWKKWFRF